MRTYVLQKKGIERLSFGDEGYNYKRNKNQVICVNLTFHRFFFCSLKTTLLKWRPDFEVAAEEYTQAGKILIFYY